MNPSLTPLPDLYAAWLSTGWSMLMGKAPAGPAKDPVLKPDQAAAVQEWEDEGGSVKSVPTPRAKAAPARKRKPSRTAKGKNRK